MPKKLIVFDLDGTLTISKSPMDDEMAELLDRLLTQKMAAVISGGAFYQFERQFLSQLKSRPEHLKNLFLFPTNGTRFLRYDAGWREVYAEMLSPEERKAIAASFEDAFRNTGYVHPAKLYGAILEDRGTQVTFSALGQNAPPEEKEKLKEEWQKNGDPRVAIVDYMRARFSDLEFRMNGMSSIDVTRKGIDKAYGIRQMIKYLKVAMDEILFVGDALFPGGNDYAVKKEGVECVEVKTIEDTKKVIRDLIGK